MPQFIEQRSEPRPLVIEQPPVQPVDMRWLRMKQGMIRRLTTELDDRIERLDRVREGLQAELSARIVIKLEP